MTKPEHPYKGKFTRPGEIKTHRLCEHSEAIHAKTTTVILWLDQGISHGKERLPDQVR